jgi:hypothetical protein
MHHAGIEHLGYCVQSIMPCFGKKGAYSRELFQQVKQIVAIKTLLAAEVTSDSE